MTRIIDADTLRITFDGNHEYVEKSDIDGALTVEAIPVEYIEYEKDRVNRFMQIAVKHGDTKEAERLTTIAAVMDALISNWRYTTGPDWRAEREEQ